MDEPKSFPWTVLLTERVDIDLATIDGVEWRDMRVVTAYDRDVLVAKLHAYDIEAVAAVVWIARRRDEPALVYEDVLRRVSLAALLGNSSPDEES